MLLEKTLEVSVSKFEELCKTDARMETLKAYISNEENGYIKLDTVKAIIGLPVKHEEPSVWEHEDRQYGYLEWDRYSNGHGGCSLYRVEAWMPIPNLYKG